MAVDMTGVRQGMEVYGSDDEKVGSVAEVVTSWRGGSGLDTGNAGGADADRTPNTYLKIEQRSLLDTEARVLWIPSTQVAAVVPGERVTLQCEAEACIEQYQQQPPGLT
jgi:hypothetical protein